MFEDSLLLQTKICMFLITERKVEKLQAYMYTFLEEQSSADFIHKCIGRLKLWRTTR